MPSALLLVAMAMPSRLPSLPFFAFLPLSLHPSGSMPPAFLPLSGGLAVLPGHPGFVVLVYPLAMVGRHAASLPAFPVPVPVAPVAPVAVPPLPKLALCVAQRRAAEAALHAGIRRLARPSDVRPSGLLMMGVPVIVVCGSTIVINVLAPVLLV